MGAALWLQRTRARLLGATFELLYRNRTLYWLASTIPFAGQWRRWQRLVLPVLAAHGGVRDVLELGCGPGWLLADLLQEGYSARAIERSPQMVAAARATLRRWLRRLGSEAPSLVTQADARALPFDAARFDAVVSTFPTDYIFDPQVAREVARVLRPGGQFVIVLGASLVPTRLLAWPFVAIQTLAYGRGGSKAPRCATGSLAALQDDEEQPRLPFASAGLAARVECVEGPFWVAYLVRAEKPAERGPRLMP